MKMGLRMEANRMGMATLGTGEDCMEEGMVREVGQVATVVGWGMEMARGGGVKQVETVGGVLEAAGSRYVLSTASEGEQHQIES